MSHKDKRKRTRTHLVLDLTLAAAFLVSFRPALTGLAIHEWLGLALGSALIVHLLLHWKWVTSVARKWRTRLPRKTRACAITDAFLLVGFLTIVGSGVAMSRAVLPLFGLQASSSMAWVSIHKLSSMLTLVLIGVKLALHWRWIKNAATNHVLGLRRVRAAQGARNRALPGQRQLLRREQ